jgi:hypothetical protein
MDLANRRLQPLGHLSTRAHMPEARGAGKFSSGTADGARTSIAGSRLAVAAYDERRDAGDHLRLGEQRCVPLVGHLEAFH